MNQAFDYNVAVEEIITLEDEGKKNMKLQITQQTYLGFGPPPIFLVQKHQKVDECCD